MKGGSLSDSGDGEDKWWNNEGEHPGQHPRWDSGAADWSLWRKDGVLHGDGGVFIQTSGWGERSFALAVEDEPLLDEDAVILGAVGLEVAPETKLVRSVVLLQYLQSYSAHSSHAWSYPPRCVRHLRNKTCFANNCCWLFQTSINMGHIGNISLVYQEKLIQFIQLMQCYALVILLSEVTP